MRKVACAAALLVVLACSGRSPTAPPRGTDAVSSDTDEAPILRADRRARTPRVVDPRGDTSLPPGVWGSDAASVAIEAGGATVEIFALAIPPNGCFGSYGETAQEIPRGAFSVPGTFTQLTGFYPGKVQYPAQFTGIVEGNRMTITITVPSASRVLGPFVVAEGVTNSWGPCLYP
jgi:hypothetical protein